MKRKLTFDFYSILYFTLPILAIALILVGTMSVMTLRSVNVDRQLLTEKYAHSLVLTNDLRFLKASETAMSLQYVLGRDRSVYAQSLALRDQFDHISLALIKIVGDPRSAALLSKVTQMRSALFALTRPILEARERGLSVEEAHSRFEKVGRTLSLQIDDALDAVFKYELLRFGEVRSHTDLSIAKLTREVEFVSVLALIAFILVATVIVRLARTQRALEQEREALLMRSQSLAQARKEILETVAHDLKNPLGSIKMSIDLALESEQAPVSSVRELLEISQRSAVAMQTLVSDLLDHAKIESGQLAIMCEPTDLRDITAGLVQRFAIIARRKGIELLADFGDKPLLVDIDPGRFDQLLSNIIGNALKFTPGGGEIEIKLLRRDGEAFIKIRDDGPGMEAAALARIFDRYWQARQTAAQGTGLGLAIVKAIAEAHKGRVWAESRPGQGSTFYVAIPLKKTHQPMASQTI